ncbi:MAG: UPF0175 family protein [Oscillospiraceae bacterium]|nr:UPF0175 family protein [Oscillospiraceae bacterium]
MQPHILVIKIPSDIMGYLQMDDEQIETKIYKLLLIDLVQRGKISFGKASELAGVDKLSFITEIGQMGIPYYDNDISEVLNDTKIIEETNSGESQ